MPQDNTGPGPVETIQKAYETATSGRRQAALAAARLHTLISRGDALPEYRAVAFEWLICWGRDGQPPVSAKAMAQSILHRLNLAIDGHGRAVTDVILTAEQIERLRLFRTQVRTLMNEAPLTSAPTKAWDFPQPQSRGIADEGTT